MHPIGSNVLLDATVTPTGLYTYQWTLGAGLTLSPGSSLTDEDIYVTSAMPGIYTATVEVFADGGCSIVTENYNVEFICTPAQSPFIDTGLGGPYGVTLNAGSIANPTWSGRYRILKGGCGTLNANRPLVISNQNTISVDDSAGGVAGGQAFTTVFVIWDTDNASFVIENECGCSLTVNIPPASTIGQTPGACCTVTFGCTAGVFLENWDLNDPDTIDFEPGGSCVGTTCQGTGGDPCAAVNCGPCGTCVNGICQCNGTCPAGNVCTNASLTSCACSPSCAALPACTATASNAPCCCNGGTVVNTACSPNAELAGCGCEDIRACCFNNACSLTTQGNCSGDWYATETACTANLCCTGMDGKLIPMPTVSGDISIVLGIRLSYCTPDFSGAVTAAEFLDAVAAHWSYSHSASSLENYLLINTSACAELGILQQIEDPTSTFVTALAVETTLNAAIAAQGKTATVSFSAAGLLVNDPNGELVSGVIILENTNVNAGVCTVQSSATTQATLAGCCP